MANHTQYGETYFIQGFEAGSQTKNLKRLAFSKGHSTEAYDEAWLQRLVMRLPSLLPIDEIEPAFEDMVPVCMELPLDSGYLDNLFVTPSGNLALIECKLWRNSESKRTVFGQIIDYANDLSKCSYQDLQDAICRTRRFDHPSDLENRHLYDIVSSHLGPGGNDRDQSQFEDAVSRNLRRGRFLLLIVGDGIREGLESMTEFLQQHAGLHFSLALVELAIFQAPNDGYIVQPRVLARTININRGIVTIEQGEIVIRSPASNVSASAGPGRQTTITKEMYFEAMEQTSPGISLKLNLFLDKLPAHNMFADFGTKSLILRWQADDTRTWNIATIVSSGEVWMDYLNMRAASLGLIELSNRYLADVASIVPGAALRTNPPATGSYVVLHGRILKIDALLSDEARGLAWLRAIDRFQSAVTAALRKRESGGSLEADSHQAEEDPRNNRGQHPTRKNSQLPEGPIPHGGPPGPAGALEKVLAVGGEGGSITLVRERIDGEHWNFRMQTNESVLIDELEGSGNNGRSSVVSSVPSLEEGLKLLDVYPWATLVPLYVHPAFQRKILEEVGNRAGKEAEARWIEELDRRASFG